MKDKLVIISEYLNQGFITELEARKQLLVLLGVSESNLFHIEFAPKGSTYPMTAISSDKNKYNIKREFEKRNYDVLNISRIYFH